MHNNEALTIETIRAAQDGDENAKEAVLDAMESRIQAVAQAEARRMLSDQAGYAEEFAQVARIAVWEGLSRFEGDTADAFFAFMYQTAATTVLGAASGERNPGADIDAVKDFGYWVKECGGDIYAAEKACQRMPSGISGKRLGRDRAHAARLAYEVPHYLDAPLGSDALSGTGHNSGHGNGKGISSQDWAAFPSTIGVPEDLITSDDISAAQRERTIGFVNVSLDLMGDQTANVLRGTFGIEPMGCFGTDQNAELGAALGITAKQVIEGRNKGYKQFAKKFIPLISHGNEVAADDWWEAFDIERQRGNASKTRRVEKAAAA